jgi:hypothetical protein
MMGFGAGVVPVEERGKRLVELLRGEITELQE